MLGLGHYESSDEEEDKKPVQEKEVDGLDEKISPVAKPIEGTAETKSQSSSNAVTSNWDGQLHPDEKTPDVGPLPGPSMADSGLHASDEPSSAPQSPYSSSRQAIRSLTLPPVANFNIPPSPPVSPPPGATAKFARFLELKKRGVHFNAKLTQSTALRNPSLLSKLMDFAGLTNEDQYVSTLPAEVAVPTKFPAWAYFDELGKGQQEIMKRKEEERRKGQRGPIEFVAGTTTEGSGSAGSNHTPGEPVRARAAKGSAAERVMAGLSRG